MPFYTTLQLTFSNKMCSMWTAPLAVASYLTGFFCILWHVFLFFLCLKTINEHLRSVSFSCTLTVCFETLESTLGKHFERFGLCLHVTGYSIDANCSPQKQNIIKNYALSHQKQKNEWRSCVLISHSCHFRVLWYWGSSNVIL